MAHVISVINLKGGVAKTTTTVALAETFASRSRKRVLVIDLDPQTNATTMLIGEKRWLALNLKGNTLATLFKDAVNQKSEFNITSTLQRQVSDVQGAESVDLLPSSLDLIDVQDLLAGAPPGQFHRSPVDLLRQAAWKLIDEYDLVLIDCPPNLGIITQNGLRISGHYLIPTVPDVLSTYGIPQIMKRVGMFGSQQAVDIKPLGIVITKFQENSTIHLNTVKKLKGTKDYPRVLTTFVRQANQIAAAAEFQETSRRTLKQKYGYGDLAEQYFSLADEILKLLMVSP